MISVDFHSHTSASKDSRLRPAELVAAARRKGIDRVVVTDHNSIPRYDGRSFGTHARSRAHRVRGEGVRPGVVILERMK